MELTVIERLLLLKLLPEQGNLTTLRIVRDMQGALSFSEDEHKALQFTNDGRELKWKAEAGVVKDVEFGPKAKEIVNAGLRKLNNGNQLTMDHLSLCDKFQFEGKPDDAAK